MGKVESGWSFAFLRQFVGRLSRFSWMTCLFAGAAGAAIAPTTMAEIAKIEKRIVRKESSSWESPAGPNEELTYLLILKTGGESTGAILDSDSYLSPMVLRVKKRASKDTQ
jgi:hypothetical protein